MGRVYVTMHKLIIKKLQSNLGRQKNLLVPRFDKIVLTKLQ